MNRAIRRVAYVVVGLMLVIVGQLTYLQFLDAKTLQDDPRNSRTALRDVNRPRGEIVSADGEILARSTRVNDEYGWQRTYPFGSLYAETVGYQSVVVGTVGLERSYDDDLTGRSFSRDLKRLPSLLADDRQTGTLVTTLRADAQAVARDALAGQRGSVTVLDPRTGAVLVMYSNPSFDPQPLASHDTRRVQRYYDALQADPAQPALARAYREIYPPGSTFKVVTTTGALDTGVATPDSDYADLKFYVPPQTTNPINNFGGKPCGGTLEDAFRRSCNWVFAKLGVDMGERFVPVTEAFGFNLAPNLDVSPGAVPSLGLRAGTFREDKPSFALAGIGQGPIASTPLQMALVAAGIANRGVVMEPHLGRRVEDRQGRVVRRVTPRAWRRATSPDTAATVTEFMVSVVRNGTGTAAQIPGVTVAGKTGTAQAPGGPPHAWFIAFAPAEAPRFAISVIIERGGSAGDEATGGRVAAPVAAKVLRTLLGAP
ncbi:MAG: peptidoglycan D,D-transpeptidase FtsI family protein [Actinomycetes bacterium]